MTRIRRTNAGDVEHILARYGFELVSQEGSHRKWRNLESQLQVGLDLGKLLFSDNSPKSINIEAF
ncbi:MAG: type II toxin-antitoxin system HicA family toxin [Cyanophyceae cyanobacterium]